jgi:hypothetical protein
MWTWLVLALCVVVLFDWYRGWKWWTAVKGWFAE